MKNEVTIIGLTGQSGAGKSTACKFFERQKFAIIDCDTIAKMVLLVSFPCKKELINAFTDEIITDEGLVDKKILGSIVFADKQKLEKLNRITHPYILAQVEKQKISLIEEGYHYIIIDAPTLFESGAYKSCNMIISVLSDKNERIKRIVQRDNITEEQAIARINSQLSEEFFKENSDFIISNDSDRADLLKQLEETVDFIKGQNDDNQIEV